MSSTDKGGFKSKHPKGSVIDETIAAEIKTKLKEGALACAVAFDIAKRLEASPAKVGQTLDLMNVRLSKCQLGLFGYKPNKKRVVAENSNLSTLQGHIEGALVDGALPCVAAWQIADQQKVSKMAVSNACEALSIKVKPCQLGAF